MNEQRSLPGFSVKTSGPDDAWKRDFWRKVRRAEKIYGKGPTYSAAQVELILEGIIPEWIFRGMLFERNPVLREQCERARDKLLKLHELLNSPSNWRNPRDVKE